MTLFTIGFTKKSAKQFFELLGASGARALVDIRLNNVSQLAGFSKRDDLDYFVHELCGMDYRHELSLAPTPELLTAYQKHALTWQEYDSEYRELIRGRRVEVALDRADFADVVLLCSEASPERCHRRVAAEYLADAWGDIEVVHL